MDLMAMVAEYVKPELLIIAVFLYVIGMFLKGAPAVQDWAIPFIILALGIIMGILYIAIMLDQGFVAKAIFEGIIQGVLCAAMAVFTNQLIKQATNK